MFVLHIVYIFHWAAYKRTLKDTLCLLWIGAGLFCLGLNGTDHLPDEKDINALSQARNQIVNKFIQDSFELRARFEYDGRFLSLNDKTRLYRLAYQASQQLETLTNTAHQIKKQIEDYSGDDWDERYGVTGLWRKLYALLYKTYLSKLEINYYMALSADQPERNHILHRIINEIDLSLIHI